MARVKLEWILALVFVGWLGVLCLGAATGALDEDAEQDSARPRQVQPRGAALPSVKKSLDTPELSEEFGAAASADSSEDGSLKSIVDEIVKSSQVEDEVSTTAAPEGASRSELDVEENTDSDVGSPTVVLTIRGDKKTGKRTPAAGTSPTSKAPVTLGPSLVIAANGTKLKANGTDRPATKATVDKLVTNLDANAKKILAKTNSTRKTLEDSQKPKKQPLKKKKRRRRKRKKRTTLQPTTKIQPTSGTDEEVITSQEAYKYQSSESSTEDSTLEIKSFNGDKIEPTAAMKAAQTSGANSSIIITPGNNSAPSSKPGANPSGKDGSTKSPNKTNSALKEPGRSTSKPSGKGSTTKTHGSSSIESNKESTTPKLTVGPKVKVTNKGVSAKDHPSSMSDSTIESSPETNTTKNPIRSKQKPRGSTTTTAGPTTSGQPKDTSKAPNLSKTWWLISSTMQPRSTTTSKPKKTTLKPKRITPKPNSKSTTTTRSPSSTSSMRPTTQPPPDTTAAPTTKPETDSPCKKCALDFESSDKILALVITKNGKFGGKRLNAKAIEHIMESKMDANQLSSVRADKPITVSVNNTFVFPAGTYYFPYPVRVAGFVSP